MSAIRDQRSVIRCWAGAVCALKTAKQARVMAVTNDLRCIGMASSAPLRWEQSLVSEEIVCFTVCKGREMTMEAYCVKCKAKREMQDGEKVTMKNGRPAMKGKCPVCGTGLYRILPSS